MDKLLTIVVPAYNMKAYLRRCLDSLIVPSIMNFVEVLIIDDGSKDNTYDIAKEYQNKFPGYFIAIHKENGNYGSVINKALEIAVGKYFRTLDADDWYDTEQYILFVENLKSIDTDLIITKYKTFKTTCGKIIEGNYASVKKYGNIQPFNIFPFKKYFDVIATPAMIYKLEVLKKCKLKLLENFYYTDTEYCYYPLQYVKDVVFINNATYIYYIGRNEQSMARNSIVRNFGSVKNISLRMIEHYSSMDKVDKSIKDNMKLVLIQILQMLYNYSYLNNSYNSELRDIDNIIKSKNTLLYDELNLTKNYRVSYIKYWRENGLRWIVCKQYLKARTLLSV